MADTRPPGKGAAVEAIGGEAVFDEASMALGRVYSAMGEAGRAESVYRDLLSVYPDHADASRALSGSMD